MSQTISLNDGNFMPRCGIMSFCNDSPMETARIVRSLVDEGLRHFEIADIYGNGRTVVENIFRGNISRSDVYITWKVWAKGVTPADLVDKVVGSLKACNLEYVDALILSDPVDYELYIDYWRYMEILKEKNVARSIGVSKISVTMMLEIVRKSSTPPAILQTEISPFKYSQDLISFCEDNSIAIVCIELFSKGLRKNNKTISELARSLGLSNEELLVQWASSKRIGLILPPKYRQLLNQFNVQSGLQGDAVEVLDSLDEGLDTLWIPATIKTQDE